MRFATLRLKLVFSALFAAVLLTALLATRDSAVASKDKSQAHLIGDVFHPFQVTAEIGERATLKTSIHTSTVLEMRKHADVRMALPVQGGESVELQLEPFNVLAPNARFVAVDPSGVERQLPTPDVSFYRGTVSGDASSYAYIALGADGRTNGYVTFQSGRRLYVSTPAKAKSSGGALETLISETPDPRFELPEGVEFCGIGSNPELYDKRDAISSQPGNKRSMLIAGGPKLARVGVDADNLYVDMFDGDETATSAYIAEVMGAISDIYERDVDCRLELAFVRLFPSGGLPYQTDNVGDFRSHWVNNEQTILTTFELNYVHLFTGRRDLSFGGIAFINEGCNDFSYGISGYLNGAFSDPLEDRSLSNWDIVVTAHEMGHNSGTGHTHDDYTPAIDNCGNGTPSPTGGTIMSYCHTHTGYMTQIEVRFHRRVQEKMQTEMDNGGCMIMDCNGNGIDDADDITGGEPDVNFDGIPDVCQDCDNDGTKDFDEIALGSNDFNANGIPDECEPDCNGNNIPDDLDITSGFPDLNGNNVPDECDPDCNGNAIPDFVEIGSGAVVDVDRNAVPDTCQDCNANNITDWKDLERQHNYFVCDRNGFVREYHQRSGWPVAQYPVPEPMGICVGAARELYVTNDPTVGGGSAVYWITPQTGAQGVLVASGGQLGRPTDILFKSPNTLYIADISDNSVKRFDTSGNFIDVFVTSGDGGLTGPYAMLFNSSGNLLVSSNDARVLEFDGTTGDYIQDFVGTGCCDVAGDADNSGSVNIGDASFLVSRIFSGGPAPVCFAEGDPNQSGTINISDVTFLIARIFSGGPAPTCPPAKSNGGLQAPRGMVFLPSGDLLVTSSGDNRVLQYDGTTGDFSHQFNDAQSLFSLWGIDMGPNGNVFIVRGTPVARLIEYIPNGRYHRYVIRNEVSMTQPTDFLIYPASDFDANQNGILDICE